MGKKKGNLVNFKSHLANKKIPILTLDPKWHELFPDYMKTSKIRSLEKHLNELLKRQGKLVNDAKDMKNLKKRLMEGIVANMGEVEGKTKYKKQAKSQDLILEINEKLRLGEEELMQIPYKIKAVNEELLIESMTICYGKIKANSEEILELAIWVARAREELKEKILIKQDKEMKNESMYSFMHNILGPEVIQLFDDYEYKDNNLVPIKKQEKMKKKDTVVKKENEKQEDGSKKEEESGKDDKKGNHEKTD